MKKCGLPNTHTRTHLYAMISSSVLAVARTVERIDVRTVVRMSRIRAEESVKAFATCSLLRD